MSEKTHSHDLPASAGLRPIQPSNPDLAPVPGPVHFALKRAYFNLALKLGVDPGKRNLVDVQTACLARAAFAQSMVDGGTGLIALLDGAADALRYNTPADLARGRQLVGRALGDLQRLMEAAATDAALSVGQANTTPADDRPGDDAIVSNSND